MDKIESIIIALLCVMLFLIGIITVKKYENPKERIEIIEKTDTSYVYVSDTVFQEKVYHLPQRIDTFIVFKNNHDTLFIQGVAMDTINIDSLKMELKGEITIIRDSIFITKYDDKKEVFSCDFGINGMIIHDVKPKFDLGAEIGLNFKEKNSIELGYYFINKQFNIGYKRKLFGIKKK